MTSFWHSQAHMGRVQHDQVVIDRGEGSYVWTEDGHKLLDAPASLWYCNIGHGRQSVVDAVTRQMQKLETYMTFDRFANRPALDLSERLVGLAPLGDDAKVYLTSGGSDAVEVAAKLSRRYWTAVGRPSKRVIVGRDRAYHGLHGFGTSIGGLAANRVGYGDLMPDVVHTSPTDWRAVEALFAETGTDRLAAFFCEPVLGTGGVVFPGEEYLREVRRLCREYEVLFVADEVITGFGRTGAWFASDRFDLQPDLLMFAKGVTSGYQPLGGVVISARVAEPFWRADGEVFRHGLTYSGHAAACAAAMANLDIMAAESLPERTATLEGRLDDAVRPLEGVEGVEEVRAGVGLLAGVKLSSAQLAADVCRDMWDQGVLMRAVAEGDVLQIAPPLIITPEEIDLIGEGIASSLRARAGSGRVPTA
jgi:adenosylmethionine-8-amino-7-oxononanoate aminotransferase